MKRRIQKMICAVLIALVLVSVFPTAMAKSVTAVVNSSSAKVYKTASKSAAHVKIGKGTTVTVSAVSGSWARVKLNGKTGYMPVKYLEAAGGSKSSAKPTGKSGPKSTGKRYTGYANKDTYVYQKASSSSSRRAISVNTKLYVVGKSGSYYKVQNKSGSATGYVKTSCVSRSKVPTKGKNSWKSQVVKVNWYTDGNRVFKKGSYGYIYDIDTGVTVRIKRMGGHNHADVEPATADDTKKLLKIAHGKFSWKSHAVILKSGSHYVASGINTMPHGDQTIHNNNYDGQFCLHMTGSHTHASDSVNANHQASIDRAYRWAHK